MSDMKINDYGKELAQTTTAATGLTIPIIIVRHDAGERIDAKYSKNDLSVFVCEVNADNVRTFDSSGVQHEQGSSVLSWAASAITATANAVQNLVSTKELLSVSLARVLDNPNSTWADIKSEIVLPADTISVDTYKTIEVLLSRTPADYARVMLAAYELQTMLRQRKQDPYPARDCLHQVWNRTVTSGEWRIYRSEESLIHLIAGTGESMDRFALLMVTLLNHPVHPHASIHSMIEAAALLRRCYELKASHAPNFRALWKVAAEAAFEINPSMLGLRELGSALDELDPSDPEGHMFGPSDWSNIIGLWHPKVQSFEECQQLVTFAERFTTPTVPMLWKLIETGLVQEVTRLELVSNLNDGARRTHVFFAWLSKIDVYGDFTARCISYVSNTITQGEGSWLRVIATVQAFTEAGDPLEQINAQFFSHFTTFVNHHFMRLEARSLIRWLQSTAYAVLQVPELQLLLSNLRFVAAGNDLVPHLELYDTIAFTYKCPTAQLRSHFEVALIAFLSHRSSNVRRERFASALEGFLARPGFLSADEHVHELACKQMRNAQLRLFESYELSEHRIENSLLSFTSVLVSTLRDMNPPADSPLVNRLLEITALAVLPDACTQPLANVCIIRPILTRLSSTTSDVCHVVVANVHLRTLDRPESMCMYDYILINLLEIRQRLISYGSDRIIRAQDTALFYSLGEIERSLRSLRGTDHQAIRLQELLEEHQREFDTTVNRVVHEQMSKPQLQDLLSVCTIFEDWGRTIQRHTSELQQHALRTQIDKFDRETNRILEQKELVLAIAKWGVHNAQLDVCYQLYEHPEREYPLCTVVHACSDLDAWLQLLRPVRAFFEYFSTHSGNVSPNITPTSSSPSILFNHFLKKRLPSQEEELRPADFASALAQVRSTLSAFVHGDQVSFSEITEAGQRLSQAGRSPDDELQILAACPHLNAPTAHTVEFVQHSAGLRSALQLGQLAEPLLRLVVMLEHPTAWWTVDCNQDEDFTALRAHSQALNTEDGLEDCTMNSFSELRATVQERLQGPMMPDRSVSDDQHDNCLGVLMLFTRLSEHDRVWRFVTEHKYFGDGFGRFRDKLTLLQKQVSGAFDEGLLNMLEQAVHYLGVLAANRDQPLETLLAALFDTQGRVMAEVRRTGGKQRFQQLEALQDQMDRLEEWFSKGLGGLDAIFAQYSCVMHTGFFEFHVTASQTSEDNATEDDLSGVGSAALPQGSLSELRLVYEEHGQPRVLRAEDLTVRLGFVARLSKGAALPHKYKYLQMLTDVQYRRACSQDFQHRLGFVQKDQKAQKEDLGIARFLEQLQANHKAFALIRELCELGHPKYQQVIRVPVIQIASSSTTSLTVSAVCLTRALKDWRERLEQVSSEHPYLRFLSTREAQRLHGVLKKQHIPSMQLSLLLILQPLFQRTLAVFADLRRATVEALSAGDISESQDDWPVTVGSFLKRVQEAMGRSPLPVHPPGAAVVCSPGLHVHTIEASSDSLLMLVLHIYKERLPESFELLWCSSSTSQRTLEAFLDRVQHHGERCFTLLQVEVLQPTVQQALLRHLLACRDAAAVTNLHCVQLTREDKQNESTALQAAAWITHHKTSLEKMTREKTMRCLRPWCVDGQDIASITYVTGPSGSGKTHWMRGRVREWNEQRQAFCIMSITEAFSFETATRQLHTAVTEKGPVKLGLCFHINLGKFRAQERHTWDALMSLINRFFFSLVVLRSVEDSSGFVFTVPPGCGWEIVVEIPDRAGHLDEPATTELDEALWRELPVLACMGQQQSPPAKFEINDDARLVCTYLKALRDERIDAVYGGSGGPSGPKDIMIVLDASDSMGWGGEDKLSPLDVCKESLQTLLDERVERTDRVGCIIFNHGIVATDRLEIWDEEHERRLGTLLDRTDAAGATQFWDPMMSAVDMLVARRAGDERRSKWIIALTDGASTDICCHEKCGECERFRCVNSTGRNPCQRCNVFHTRPQPEDQPCEQLCLNTKCKGLKARLRQEDAREVTVLTIAVGLKHRDEMLIASACNQGRSELNQIIKVEEGGDIAGAWQEAGAYMSVSEQIEAEPPESDDECHELLRIYMQPAEDSRLHRPWSMLQRAYWMRYVHRRCGILRASSKFNFKEVSNKFGSTTMKIMLQEARHALSEDYRKDWGSVNHEQFVYWSEGEDTNWSLIATRPDAINEERKELLREIQLHVPSTVQLRERRILDSYLACGLGIGLQKAAPLDPFPMPIGTLDAIDKEGFVLTLDFTMKFLCMNERIVSATISSHPVFCEFGRRP